jgi:hypothetical protein
VGFCSGCEKWWILVLIDSVMWWWRPNDLYGRHTGVMWMQRQGAGVECMQRWREILLSGKFSTDQQSLDEAEALGEPRYSLHSKSSSDHFNLQDTAPTPWAFLRSTCYSARTTSAWRWRRDRLSSMWLRRGGRKTQTTSTV